MINGVAATLTGYGTSWQATYPVPDYRSNVSTLAGSAGIAGNTDGIGMSARFNKPYCLTADGNTLYVTDTYSHTIRKVIISSGEVTTLAGTAGSTGSSNGIGTLAKFYSPTSVTTDGINLYVTDQGNELIR